MALRDSMTELMINEIRDPNGCSRYGRYFYTPKVVDTKREKKFNAASLKEGKINLNALDELSDEEFLDAYNIFMRRYSTWM